MRLGRDIGFELFTSLVVSAVLQALPAETDATFLVMAFVAVFAVVAFVDRRETLTKMARSPGDWKLGNWRRPQELETKWTYDKERTIIASGEAAGRASEPAKDDDVHGQLFLRQVGSFVWGEGKGSRGGPHGKHFEYKVSGAINREGVLRGEWRSTRHNYYGTLQLAVTREGAAEGRWLGVAEKNEIRGGLWSWKKKEQATMEK